MTSPNPWFYPDCYAVISVPIKMSLVVGGYFVWEMGMAVGRICAVLSILWVVEEGIYLDGERLSGEKSKIPEKNKDERGYTHFITTITYSTYPNIPCTTPYVQKKISTPFSPIHINSPPPPKPPQLSYISRKKLLPACQPPQFQIFLKKDRLPSELAET